jgi:uncharacterized membrane protein
MPVRGAPAVVLSVLTALALAAGFAPSAFAVEVLTLTTPFPAISVAPGDDVTFDLSVDTDVAARVNLAVSGVPEGWTATLRGGGFVVDGVQTSGGDPTTVQLNVAVPQEATEAPQRIIVTATSEQLTTTLQLDIRVAAEAAGEVTLETDVAQLRGASDDTFSFTLTLSNDTATELTYSVTGQGEPGWEVEPQISGQAQAASATVDAGGTATITTSVTPPANVQAGTYPLSVTAAAGDRTVTQELQVEITGSFEMALTTPGDRLSTRGEAGSVIEQTVIVRNDGTAPLETVALTGTAPTDWRVEFDPTDVGPVPPGETGNTVQSVARITPSGDAIAGDYVVTLTATHDEATATQQLRVTIETSPLFGLVGVALIVLVLVGLLWVFRTYGRR